MSHKDTKVPIETQESKKSSFLNTLIILLISPIISQIALMIFKPIMEATRLFGGNLFLAFDNFFFKMAATLTEFTLPTFVVQNGLSFILAYTWFHSIRIYRKTTTSYESIHSCENAAESDKTIDEKPDEKILRLKAELQSGKRTLRRMSICWVIYTSFFVTLVFIYMILPFNLLSNFNINITLITPYTDSHTIAVLKSDWVQMKSRNDYNSIKKRINMIWHEHETKSNNDSSEKASESR